MPQELSPARRPDLNMLRAHLEYCHRVLPERWVIEGVSGHALAPEAPLSFVTVMQGCGGILLGRP